MPLRIAPAHLSPVSLHYFLLKNSHVERNVFCFHANGLVFQEAFSCLLVGFIVLPRDGFCRCKQTSLIQTEQGIHLKHLSGLIIAASAGGTVIFVMRHLGPVTFVGLGTCLFSIKQAAFSWAQHRPCQGLPRRSPDQMSHVAGSFSWMYRLPTAVDTLEMFGADLQIFVLELQTHAV